MDEAKGSLEGLVHEVCEMVLHLLGALDICELKGNIGEEVHVIVLYLVALL